jgi:hypothetical protein
MKSTEQSRITYAVEKADEDLIILGSSRANHHYIPTVLKDSLNISVYNAGCDGQFILYDFCILNRVLARKKTKIVILDMLPWEFQSGKGYDQLSVLLPYYYLDTSIREIVNLRSKFEKFKAISSLYRYNSQISTIISNNIFPKNNLFQSGYLPLSHKWTMPIEIGDASGRQAMDLDTVKLRVFRSFLDLAKDNGVKVFVFVSPLFIKNRDVPVSVELGRRICADYKIPFLDFSAKAFFMNHPELFNDPYHLNNSGAEIYSSLVAKEIKSSIQLK